MSTTTATSEKKISSSTSGSTSASTSTSTSSSDETRVYVVTGSSRGLGLELVRQLAAEKNSLVFATVRNPDTSDELKKLAASTNTSSTSSGGGSSKIEIVKLDTANETSIQEGAKEIAAKTKKIHILFNNAAIAEAKSTVKTTKTELINSFTVNVAGPLLVTQALFPLLQAAQTEEGKVESTSSQVPKVINISSTIGSVGTATTSKGTEIAGYFQNITPYRVSKTALNSLTVAFAGENPGIAFLTICPGWVDTDMGRSGGAVSPLKAPESIKGVLSVVNSLTLADSGTYRNYQGKTLPW